MTDVADIENAALVEQIVEKSIDLIKQALQDLKMSAEQVEEVKLAKEFDIALINQIAKDFMHNQDQALSPFVQKFKSLEPNVRFAFAKSAYVEIKGRINKENTPHLAKFSIKKKSR